MSTVAQQLQTAREARNLTVYQVAETTKIRTDHVRALEEGNFNAFPAPVYIRGFVRTYANLLKLDVPRVMADLEAELAQTTKFREPPPLSAQSRGVLDFLMLQLSKVNWRAAVVVLTATLIIVGATAGVMAWRRRNQADPLRSLPPAVYHSAPSGATLPLPPPPNRHP